MRRLTENQGILQALVQECAFLPTAPVFTGAPVKQTAPVGLGASLSTSRGVTRRQKTEVG